MLHNFFLPFLITCANTKNVWILNDIGSPLYSDADEKSEKLLQVPVAEKVALRQVDARKDCYAANTPTHFCAVTYRGQAGWLALADLIKIQPKRMYTRIESYDNYEMQIPLRSEIWVIPDKNATWTFGSKADSVSKFYFKGHEAWIWSALLSTDPLVKFPIMSTAAPETRPILRTPYIVDTYPDGTPAELTFIDNNHFAMLGNLCQGMVNLAGTYSINELLIELAMPANSWSRKTKFYLEIQSSSELLMLTDYSCNPRQGDMLKLKN